MPPNQQINSAASHNRNESEQVAQKTVPAGVIKAASYTTQESNRAWWMDAIAFVLPSLFWRVTPIWAIYLTGLLRIASCHAILSLHYLFVDKDNYSEKLSQKQLQREKKEYLVGIVLHMWSQVALQLLFPGMFFPAGATNTTVLYCAYATLATHVCVVEPLYYVVHRWLHVPDQMKAMHGFHHQSINTVPSTSLVQNFQEHFVYIATFGPAMILPYFVLGKQHWLVVATYLVMFDVVNAYGHTNIRARHWLFTSPYSPMRYLIYTPEFHLGHHAYYNYNFGLFMPIWDHLFGTYRQYEKPGLGSMMPQEKQDFVFIGHNGGLGHLLTIPEVSVYNVYDSYRRTWLPLEAEFLLVALVNQFVRLAATSYKCSRYLVDGKHIGRIVCILRTPMDYMRKKVFAGINADIVKLIKDENRRCGTRYFGLGNLNKMKTLNDGGREISRLVAADPELCDRMIRVWTGDTLTAASVLQQILALPFESDEATTEVSGSGVGPRRLFYIGAGGKIGKTVSKMLADRGFLITIYSKYVGEGNLTHPNICYTQNLRAMLPFKYVLVGKLLRHSEYHEVLRHRIRNQLFLDYCVPFIPIVAPTCDSMFNAVHVQIGLLRNTNDNFLKGPYDICMGTPQGYIFPCHAGCIINMTRQLERDETGNIQPDEVEEMWQLASTHGLVNRDITDFL